MVDAGQGLSAGDLLTQMKIEAVVFDMDGVVLDTEPLYKVAWQRAATELGYDLDDASYAKLVGRPADDSEAALPGQFGSAFPLDRFRLRWPELWQTEVARAGIAVKPGLLEFLAYLDQESLPFAIATSSDSEYAEASLRGAGLAGRFSTLVTVDQVAHGKPAPDIYVEAARRLGVEPARCVALEDSEAGILAASRAGMIALLIPDWVRPSEAADPAAFRVLESLNDARDLVAALLAEARAAG
jgi:beta-phosphoglucomutase